MTEQEAIQIALKYAVVRGLSTEHAVVKGMFVPVSSLFNVLDDPDDEWVVYVEFPLLQGMDANFYTIRVNCRTREASSSPHA